MSIRMCFMSLICPFIRAIDIKRAEAKITLANMACKMDRPIFHELRTTMG